MTETTVTDEDQAAELRNAMTTILITDGYIDSPDVEAAFRKVPRGRRDATGTVTSVSAPWMQARLIAQAGIQPGMRVLEIGSGGYSAALLAEITGIPGRVVREDIDPDVTARATTALNATGYAGGRYARRPPADERRHSLHRLPPLRRPPSERVHAPQLL